MVTVTAAPRWISRAGGLSGCVSDRDRSKLPAAASRLRLTRALFQPSKTCPPRRSWIVSGGIRQHLEIRPTRDEARVPHTIPGNDLLIAQRIPVEAMRQHERRHRCGEPYH